LSTTVSFATSPPTASAPPITSSMGSRSRSSRARQGKTVNRQK
jgi:hypothetical protein